MKKIIVLLSRAVLTLLNTTEIKMIEREKYCLNPI